MPKSSWLVKKKQMIEEAWFFFSSFFSEEHGFKDIPKRSGRRSNFSKNWKKVFGRGQADKWKETLFLQLQNHSPDWANKSGWSKKVSELGKNSHEQQICSLPLPGRASHLLRGREKAMEWERFGELGGGSEEATTVGGGVGSRVGLLGFEPSIATEQLWGLAQSFQSLHFLTYEVRVIGDPVSSGCCKD